MEKEKIYAEIPNFDQENEYVVQLEPVESEDSIYYGIEIRQIEKDDENIAMV